MNDSDVKTARTPGWTGAAPKQPTGLRWKITMLEVRMVGWWAKNGITLLRLSLGLVFLWFGVLKFFPGASAAEALATRTISVLTSGHMSPAVSLPVLATWECAIGVGLLSGRFLRATLLLLFAQMTGTFLPLAFFPHETFKLFPFIPNLEGQYIIKNLVLVSAGLVVGATVRGGRLLHDGGAADLAEATQARRTAFRERYRQEP